MERTASATTVVGGSAQIAAMRPELEPAMSAARSLPVEQLARLIGDLEEVRCVAMSRLIAPTPAPQPDELVDIQEAARRLGVSKDYLYRHAGKFQFTKRIGRKVLFSSLGISRYITARR